MGQSGQEKTEQPTAKKRQDARKEGNIFQSRDVATVLILAGVFSLFALLTTFWSNTLALRDVVHEQIGSGNRISWLIATVPCILFAVFGVNSFIVLTRIMSGVVVLVSIMLVLTYGKSRKNAGSSPICGVIGTVPFQVLMVISTVLSAIGALIPLS